MKNKLVVERGEIQALQAQTGGRRQKNVRSHKEGKDRSVVEVDVFGRVGARVRVRGIIKGVIEEHVLGMQSISFR